ncbi:hypothetical protein DFH11DRAFT_1734863 [Phellopilus nigrolimitatus]|nr:hypothetical protein DFH11DRAFT_1734863 [Phellopilus nigrolimitatus]
MFRSEYRGVSDRGSGSHASVGIPLLLLLALTRTRSRRGEMEVLLMPLPLAVVVSVVCSGGVFARWRGVGLNGGCESSSQSMGSATQELRVPLGFAMSGEVCVESSFTRPDAL